ncbi:MAG TPA: LuxR C-terminal-related transcriptional regulator [Streptosporangiaceae bacterium]|nr:LuxR C-terminal-related transcriptional regulator [Streptosporangiaceae bacterium]
MTFLVADVDPSSRQHHPPDALARFQATADAALAAHGGCRCAARTDEGMSAVFGSAAEALGAAAQFRLADGLKAGAPQLAPLLRVALHTGGALVRGDGMYAGPALRRCQLLCDIANGGQTLLSAAAASAAEVLPPDLSLVDLGLHRLRDLSPPERVFELRHPGCIGDAASLRSLDMFSNNLPVLLTSFVGRERELAELHTLLAGERLLTITGAGGSGKTRLAAQAAAEQAGRWRDGVVWAELAPLSNSLLVSELVASAAGVLVEPTTGPLRSLLAQLRGRQLLLCLDNCEHALGAAAEVADAVQRGCPEVAVLATSREPLGLAAEVVWSAPALGEEEALSLFVERGSRVRPWFTLDARSEAAVRSMCTRLDGMPLAIELAAAWLRTLTPQQIDAGLDDRFTLLVGGPRGAAARQQTLTASIQWSHDLLDEPDKVVFRRLAVFAGGFTLEAAQAVCADGAAARGGLRGAMRRLIDKSLVLAENGGGEGRYRMLETIRQYAADRLRQAGEAATVCDRHLGYYIAAVEAAVPLLERDKDSWRTRWETEHENLRAALNWGLASDDPGHGRRLAAALPWLWHLHGHGPEGIETLQRAIGREPEDRSALQARLLVGVALVADTSSPLGLEYYAAQRGLAIATERGDERARGLCLLLSAVGRFYIDFDAAWTLSLQAQQSAVVSGDGFVEDGARALQGIILHCRDRHGGAQHLLQAATVGLIRRGDRGVAATAMGFQAVGALCTGDLELARSLAQEAVELAEPLGDYHRVGTSRSVLAMVLGATGEIDAALRLMAPVLQLVDEAGTEVFVPGMARVLGTLHLWRGDPGIAVQWLRHEAQSNERGAGTHLAAQSLPPLGAALRYLGQRNEASGVLDRAVTLARTLDMPRVLADALDQQGHLAASADPHQALDLHHHALAIRAGHGLRTFFADSLEALAALDAVMARGQDAVRMLAASDRARRAMGCPRHPIDHPAHLAAIAALRARLGDDHFEKAWTAGAGLSLDDAVSYIRRTRGSRGRPPTGWASLTPAELQVVHLAAEGLTNPQIGARCFMSRGTVKTHLAHVYAKLGVANRTELATLAAERAPTAARNAER